MDYSPIALFVFNRLDHTKKTVQHLSKNQYAKESELYIFSDAPRNSNDEEGVNRVRKYLRTIEGFKNIYIKEANSNKGLALSIKEGISYILSIYETVIVLEDDIITSNDFLKFMDTALKVYSNNKKVMQVSGYNYPINKKIPDYYFSTMASCWGWGTWKRSWDLYNEDYTTIENQIPIGKIRDKFKVYRNHHFWNQIMNNKNGKIRTWFIFFYASIFINDGLVLYSKTSFTNNIGMDGSGVHNGSTSVYHNRKLNTKFKEEDLPKYIEENSLSLKLYKKYFKTVTGNFFIRNIRRLFYEMDINK